MASTVLTKPSTRVGRAAGKRWRLAGQHRAGIHCSIATNGVRDAHQEADHAADTSADDNAFRCWSRTRVIARELGISHSTVREYLARVAAELPYWARPISPTRRRPGHRACRTGSAHTCGCSASGEASPPGARQSEKRVHKASFYDPEINRSYGAMAAHHGVGILSAHRLPRWKMLRP